MKYSIGRSQFCFIATFKFKRRVARNLPHAHKGKELDNGQTWRLHPSCIRSHSPLLYRLVGGNRRRVYILQRYYFSYNTTNLVQLSIAAMSSFDIWSLKEGLTVRCLFNYLSYICIPHHCIVTFVL
jgi:hypothetical protein